MSTEADILREFLVRLGFQVDKASAKVFDDKIDASTRTVLKLGSAVTAVAVTVAVAVKRISEKLDELYWASQRTGASAANIKAYEYAISQLGGTSDGARQSLEAVARLLRNSPGAEGLLQRLGVNTRDGNGQLRDTVDMIGELGTALRAMPYYKANAYANVLGIDERTLMAIRNGTGEFAKEYRDLLQRAGLDMRQATKDGMLFTRELRGLSQVVGVLATKFAALLSAKFAQNIRSVREYFIANLDRIVAGIETVIRIVGGIVDAIGQLFGRAVELVRGFLDWFGKLSPYAQDAAKAIALVAAAWAALNIVFNASPVGRVLALGAALLALYDDYKTWKEGGKALIDWKAWEPVLDAAAAAVNALGRAFKFAYEWQQKWAQRHELTNTPISLRDVEGDAGTETMRRALGMRPRGSAPASGAAGDKYGMGGGATAADVPKTGSPRARAMQFFVDSGWTREQAAGIVANLRAESGFNHLAEGDPDAKGRPQAFGIAQWHPDRQAAFAKWAGHDIRQSTLDEQLRFVQHELTQGAERRAGDLLRATRSADLAGQVVSLEYERPRDAEGEAERRGAGAVEISQTTNITVNGAGDPNATARAVTGAQNDVNNQLVRNTRGAVR